MNYLKKTRLALLVALMSGGVAHAQVSSVHDKSPDAPDDTWQMLEGDRENARINTPAGQDAQPQEQKGFDTNLGEDDESKTNSGMADTGNTDMQKQTNTSIDEDVEYNPQVGAVEPSDKGATSQFNQQAANGESASKKEDTIYFEFDSAELTSEAKDKLSQLVEDMKGKNEPLSITVAGHTDQTGPEPYNEDLAERRAEAVKEYLKQSELEVSNVDVRAVGESNPVSEDAAENRRVEVEPEGESEGLSATSAE